jgi:hypothetical protein
MSAPDYPLLALGSYETYQLAHIATFIAERLARHRHSAKGREGRTARAEAVRDIAGAATALSNATGTTTTGDNLPRPLDRETLAAIGESGWAVVGHVPGVGAVGARVNTERLAEALRAHFMTRPAGELAVWAVSEQPQRLPTLPCRVDLAAFVEQLEPSSADDRAVARNLRGQDRRVDAAIRGRFAGVDLDAPAVVNPPDRSLQPSRATPPGAAVSRTATRSAARLRLHRPTAALRVPSTSAGP